ncbi:Piso0_002707 [Millerozyma farinosa CBS 7064]|uniref:Piso0_002707 protein n=1 Tax=Pichia sorbitophila (strain ATCC MYA-4447 / BCRC 22081 / CBS 7064 / NBRC 10061 / NRRL Y-12695) TaxID=559304 RepID=G8YFR6_PICSO|nr:Piso0_002707 [Millerozyma farinosa CBS 7064]
MMEDRQDLDVKLESNTPEEAQRSANEDSKEGDSNDTVKNKPSKRRKRKVEIACVYCRRSHMICDDSRPCQRCIKRGIGHLCYDEPSNSRQRKKAASLAHKWEPKPTQSSAVQSPEASSGIVVNNSKDQRSPVGGQYPQYPRPMSNSVLSQTLPYNQEPFFYSEHAGSEFSSLNDFLSIIDDPDLVSGTLNEVNTSGDPLYSFGINSNNMGNLGVGNTTSTTQNVTSGSSNSNNLNGVFSLTPNMNTFPPNFAGDNGSTKPIQPQSQYQQQQLPSDQQSLNQKAINTSSANNQGASKDGKPATQQPQPVISDSARDKFFLTAADPTTEISPEERLKQVIKAKLEAGLLQPYNYARGYARLQSYMDNYMNVSSRQRILKPLSVFRPAFRAIARTLKDVDLVLVEESFERMLLDYDRVFTSMAIPACLWRRTGEIYRGNKEFASLVGVTTDDLKDGRLAIYELMSEESAVNFWEKYGAIAFDKGQKAVLTSCNLRTRDGIKRKSCCFSFTIRRDRYNIPSCIVGNFIPIDP